MRLTCKRKARRMHLRLKIYLYRRCQRPVPSAKTLAKPFSGRNAGAILEPNDNFASNQPQDYHSEITDSDGLVAESSAKFGKYRGNALDIPVSHVQIIDLFSKKSQKEKIYAFYKKVARELSEMGF